MQTRKSIAPVSDAAIQEFHSSGIDHERPSPAIPGSVFGSAPVDKWRSREGGMQADTDTTDDCNGVEVLWALKDHVRTTGKQVALNANAVLNTASQHSMLADILSALQNFGASSQGTPLLHFSGQDGTLRAETSSPRNQDNSPPTTLGDPNESEETSGIANRVRCDAILPLVCVLECMFECVCVCVCVCVCIYIYIYFTTV